MHSTRHRLSLMVLLFLFHFPSMLMTQTHFPSQPERQQSVEQILEGLSSPSWRDRHAMFRTLTKHDLANDRIRLAVFNLLCTEVNPDGSWAVEVGSDAEAEGLIEYIIAVKEAVIALNDSGAVPCLIRHIFSGTRVQHYLVQNASVSLPMVVDRFHHGSVFQQRGAAISLGMMLSEKFTTFVTQSQKDSIHNELLNVLNDPEQNPLKEYVLMAFGESGDSKYRALIEKYLLHSDPKLRIAAQSALEKLSRVRVPFR